jgi:DNA invertase Pin-like site-specific DNA recombinase
MGNTRQRTRGDEDATKQGGLGEAYLMLSVMGAFAEFERALSRERQREGIALAKQRGAYRGSKKARSPARLA